MQPLLNDNYLVLISKKVKNIKKDMIYGFTVDNKIVIKRAIAVNENIVEIKNGILYINNQEDKRNYKIVFSNDNFGPEKIKNDEVFFLGDNRLQSIDSRSYGAININKIEFRVIMIIFPMKKLSVILWQTQI